MGMWWGAGGGRRSAVRSEAFFDECVTITCVVVLTIACLPSDNVQHNL